MSTSSGPDKPIAIYYSCANTKEDQALLQQLNTSLAVSRRKQEITTWHEGQISSGGSIEQERIVQWEQAQIILLLLSPAYFEDDHCCEQMQLALQRLQTAGTRVIPILLRPTPGWEATPIGDLQALPQGNRPITSWNQREEALANVADRIRNVALQLREQQHPLQLSNGVMCVEPPPHKHSMILQRETLVNALYAKLTQPDVSSVVLSGLKGVGKSTLAAQVYDVAEQRRCAGEGPFTGAALWLKIEATGTLTDLLRVIAAALRQDYDSLTYLSSQAKDFSHPRFKPDLELFYLLKNFPTPRLIVLDQFETWLDTQTETEPAKQAEITAWLDLLNGHPCASRILFTAHTYPQGTGVARRLYQQEFPLPGFQPSEGLTLLRLWGIPDPDRELLRAVQHCEGHALALVLLDHLRQQLQVSLATLLDDPAYKQLWLKDVQHNILNYIYEYLLKDEKQRQLLLAFCIYREAVPWQAAYAITHAQSLVTEEQTLRALGVLQGYQLFQRQDSGEKRYILHPLVADYARGRFATEHNHSQTLDKHQAHIAAAYYYQQHSTHSGQRRQRVDDVHMLVEALWHLCQAEQYQEAYTLMRQEHLFGDLYRWGCNTILLSFYQMLLPLERWNTQVEQAAHISYEIGEVYKALGQKNAARDSFANAWPCTVAAISGREKSRH